MQGTLKRKTNAGRHDIVLGTQYKSHRSQIQGTWNISQYFLLRYLEVHFSPASLIGLHCSKVVGGVREVEGRKWGTEGERKRETDTKYICLEYSCRATKFKPGVSDSKSFGYNHRRCPVKLNIIICSRIVSIILSAKHLAINRNCTYESKRFYWGKWFVEKSYMLWDLKTGPPSLCSWLCPSKARVSGLLLIFVWPFNSETESLF